MPSPLPASPLCALKVQTIQFNTFHCAGGLLSTHVLLQQAPDVLPGYPVGSPQGTDGSPRGNSLLDLAVQLADRLLPAFDTPTGIPLSWINLKRVRAWHCCLPVH